VDQLTPSRDVIRRRRGVALAAALLIVLAAPSAAAGAFVPSPLLQAASEHPDDLFSVIVQGTPGGSSNHVAAEVQQQEQSGPPGHEDGISRRFTSLSAVAAQLTGHQIVQLAGLDGIRAITPDVPLVASLADPPVNVVAPSVSGTAQDGSSLAALNGEWSGGLAPVSFGYQWLRCDAVGAGCAAIGGAVSASYAASSADVGSTLAVSVTATGADGESASAVSLPAGPVAALPPPQVVPPANVAAPTVSGVAEVGETLTAFEGVWAGSGPLSFAWQWQRCSVLGDNCADVPGATGASYLLSGSEIGLTVRVVVSATDAAGSASAASPPSAPVAALPPPVQVAPPVNTLLPSVSGTAQVGASLSAVQGVWSGGVAPLSFAYQWLRCDSTGCVAIAGAASANYVPSSADVGSTLEVTETATDAAGAAVSASSAPSAPVPPPPPAPPVAVGSPTLSNTPQEGAAITATAGNWNGDAPIAYAYSWQRCNASGASCVEIAGAAASTYTPAAEDVGATLRVAVTATNSAGSASAVSEPTLAVLPAPPVDVDLPLLPAAPVASSSLTATTGTWTSPAPVGYTYRWERCDETGASCADIGATSATYTTTANDVGATLRVVVTATNAGGSTSAVSAASDRVVPQSPSGFWSWQLWPYVVRADALWNATSNASSPTPAIAVVDSGVDASLPGLAGAVSQQVTLTSLQQSSAADGYGHGSFVAQVAAGRAPGEAGAAPTAPIVSLDVMDDNGMAMTSDVIAAADWIYTHKDADGIRVANFSLVGSSPSSVQFDPLDQALEKLWLSGVVVVTAAGNYGVGGASTDVAYAPANDPFAITVGAADTAGTVAVADDFAAPWSVYGHTLDGFAKPDVGAPGRYMVARVPTNSTLYLTRPDRIVAPGQLQLSGTSFAAPVVAGIAADLLAAHPSWTPDQVKGALMLSAAVPGASAPFALGVGEVDAAAANAVADPPNPNVALESFLIPDPAGGPTPVFDAASWGTAVQANASWGTASWGTASWGTASWGTASWGTTYWSSASWGTASWGTASWGTSSAPADNATADFLPGGAYWMHWP
jgi:subtilase family protein